MKDYTLVKIFEGVSRNSRSKELDFGSPCSCRNPVRLHKHNKTSLFLIKGKRLDFIAIIEIFVQKSKHCLRSFVD